MSEFWTSVIEHAIPAVIGALTGAGTAYLLANKREELDAKHSFRATVRKIIWKVASRDDLAAVHKDSLIDLAADYYRVRRFIGENHRLKADHAWHEYADLKENDFAPNLKVAEMKDFDEFCRRYG